MKVKTVDDYKNTATTKVLQVLSHMIAWSVILTVLYII